MIINGERCTLEIKSRIAIAVEAINKKKAFFTSKLDLYLRKKLVKCYVWSITWALLKVERKYVNIFDMWCWRGLAIISWTNCVRNEEALQ
jgi:hypothetical protein